MQQCNRTMVALCRHSRGRAKSTKTCRSIRANMRHRVGAEQSKAKQSVLAFDCIAVSAVECGTSASPRRHRAARARRGGSTCRAGTSPTPVVVATYNRTECCIVQVEVRAELEHRRRLRVRVRPRAEPSHRHQFGRHQCSLPHRPPSIRAPAPAGAESIETERVHCFGLGFRVSIWDG